MAESKISLADAEVRPDPTHAEYLAVVSEWSSRGHTTSTRVGNAYPIYCITENRVVARPVSEFPNPGAVFLPSRGDLEVWDFVRVRPVVNSIFRDESHRSCGYITRFAPIAITDVPPDCSYASLLDLAAFDPADPSTVLHSPPQSVTPLFFVRTAQQKIFGPLRRVRVERTEAGTIDRIEWSTPTDDALIFEFTPESLLRKGLQVVRYEHPEPELNEVLKRPIHLVTGPVTTVASDKAYDRLQPELVAEWYLRWRGEAQEVPDAVLRTLRLAPTYLEETASEAIRQRCWRLSKLFETLEVLQAERRAIARRFLESEDGKKILAEQLAAETDRRAAALEEEVRKRRTELAREGERLQARLHALHDVQRREEQAVIERQRVLQARRTKLEEEMAAFEARLRDDATKVAARLSQDLPLIALLTGTSRTKIERPPARPAWAELPPPQPTRELQTVASEADLVDRLTAACAEEGLGLARDFVANLYVCLKASPLNLLAGPPGYGQALMVGALARALGHGEAVLDITVRHSWDDDRQLLGVHDPAAGGFEPGPTGLAPRLLQAEADWGGERRGLYLILLQDFNVAPPEHYFAAFLNALGRPPGQRVVSLADPAADDPPYAIRLGPNVRFWGTVHADRATFPLSPRLLDQAGLIFPSPHDLAPHPHEPTQRKPVGGIAANGLIDRFVHEAEECPAGRWDILQPLLDLVVCASGDWGPGLDVSPRVQEAMRRYLANSVGVLAPARAADFVFQQRVVPILHGRGARFSARLETLAARAADSGLERTARHLYDALGRADAAGDVDLLNG